MNGLFRFGDGLEGSSSSIVINDLREETACLMHKCILDFLTEAPGALQE